MNKILIIAFVVSIVSCQSSKETHVDENKHENHQAQESTEKEKPKSPRTAAMAMVAGNHIHIDYSAPSVRDRVIWGGLIAYDQVWVTGAHKATSIKFNKDLKIKGNVVPAGKYGLFTIPGKDKWTIILNKNWDQHLADDYNMEDDILRFEVIPEVSENNQEVLQFEVTASEGNNGQISISWEKLSIVIDVEVL